MKEILIVLTILIAGCAGDSEVRVSTGDSIKDKDLTRGADGWLISKSLPDGAGDVVYLGKGWVSFSFDGSCFLLADHSRASAMANYECK